MDAILPADVVPAVRRDLVSFIGDLTEHRRRAGADQPRGHERAGEQRAEPVELERVRAPHLGEKARAQRSADRPSGVVRPHGHEEGRADSEASEELEQARDPFVQTAARVDVHAQANHRAIGDHQRRVPGRTARRAAQRSAGSATPPALCTRVIRSVPLARRHGDAARRDDLDDRPRRGAARRRRTDRRGPQVDARRTVADERAGIRLGDRADHVEDPGGRPGPFDAAVLGTAPRHGRRPPRILWDPRRHLGEHRRVGLEQQLDADLRHALVQGKGGVVRLDVDRPLGHDVARVGGGGHVMERDAGPRLAVHDHPVERRTAAVRRQQRAVQVERGDPRQRQELGCQEPAVPHGEQ